MLGAFSCHKLAQIATLAFLSLALSAAADWIAFNDHSPGAFGPAGMPGTQTGSNVTLYNAFGTTNRAKGGPLTNALTGEQITYNGQPTTVIIVTNYDAAGADVSSGNAAGVPAPGTPLADNFDGYVYFGSSTGSAIQTRPNSYCTYIFTNLDPNAHYTFRGGAVRAGGATYSNRWAMYDIRGISSATSAHEQSSTSPWGIMTPDLVPGQLTGYQVAIQTGINTNGDMAVWTDIIPIDRGFSVVCTAYRGIVVSGQGTDPNPCTTGGSYGYAISGFRLEQVSTVGGPLVVNLAPANQTVLECSTVIYTANISGGTPPYSVQWYQNNTSSPVPGATNSSLTLTNVHPSDNGDYFVVVADSTPTPGPWINVSESSGLTVATNLSGPLTMLSALSQTDLHSITLSFSKEVNVSSATGADFLVHPLDNSANIVITNSYVTNSTNVILVTAEPLPQKNYQIKVQGSGVTGCADSVPDGTAVALVQQIDLITVAGSSWQYNQAGVALPSNWILNGYDDCNAATGWLTGTSPLDGKRSDAGERTTIGGFTVGTHLVFTNANYPSTNAVIPTYYFKHHFTMNLLRSNVTLKLRTMFDDWGIVYLNGQEGFRHSYIVASNEAFGYYTLGYTVTDAALSAPVAFPKTNLFSGPNVLAVYLKQGNTNSSDITMGLELIAAVSDFTSAPPPRATLLNNNNGTVTVSWTPPSGVLYESANLRNWSISTNQTNGAPRAMVNCRFFQVR